MNTKKITFNVGNEDLVFEITEPLQGYLLIESYSPWTSRELPFQVKIDSFREDSENLLPAKIIDQEDQISILMPKFIETLSNHISK